jgi:hypothetical protein
MKKKFPSKTDVLDTITNLKREPDVGGRMNLMYGLLRDALKNKELVDRIKDHISEDEWNGIADDLLKQYQVEPAGMINVSGYFKYYYVGMMRVEESKHQDHAWSQPFVNNYRQFLMVLDDVGEHWWDNSDGSAYTKFVKNNPDIVVRSLPKPKTFWLIPYAMWVKDYDGKIKFTKQPL